MTRTIKIIPIIFLSAILIGVAFTSLSIQDIKPANAQVAGETLFVSTFGCPPPGFCSTDGEIHSIVLTSGVVTKILSGLNLPEDGAVSPTTGQVYFVEACFRLCDVAQTITGKIIRFNADGSGLTTVLSSTTLQPEGLSFDAAGNLFFNTRSGLDGAVYQIAGGNPANAPVAATPIFTTFGEGSLITSKGNLLAVDRVSVGSVAGRVVDFGSSFPTTGSGTTIITGLTNAIGIAEDSAGLIYVAEQSIGKIFKYNPDGTGKTLFATGLGDPIFIEFDSKDNLYVAENSAGQVTKIAPDGTKTIIATIPNVAGLAITQLLPPAIEKELLEGPDEIGIYLPLTTGYVYTIEYTGPAALVKDTVPAEFEVLSLVPSDGDAIDFQKGKGGKSATKIEWDVPAGTNTLTVEIQTVASSGKGHKDPTIVFKPTSCGPLPINDGATAFEVDENGDLVLVEVTDPDTGEVTLQPVVIVGPSNSLEVEAVEGAKPCIEVEEPNS